MSESVHFKVEKEEQIAWITLNRPEKRNVMGTAFFNELAVLLDKLDQDTSVLAGGLKY